jgi:hypothetical protein
MKKIISYIILVFLLIVLIGCNKYDDDYLNMWDDAFKDIQKEQIKETKGKMSVCNKVIYDIDMPHKGYIYFLEGISMVMSESVRTDVKEYEGSWIMSGEYLPSLKCRKGSAVGENINYFYCKYNGATGDDVSEDGIVLGKSEEYTIYLVGEHIKILKIPNRNLGIHQVKVLGYGCELGEILIEAEEPIEEEPPIEEELANEEIPLLEEEIIILDPCDSKVNIEEKDMCYFSSAQNLVDCNKIISSDLFGQCIIQVATKQKNPDFCEEIKVDTITNDMKDSCFINVATNSKDPSICERLSGEVTSIEKCEIIVGLG